MPIQTLVIPPRLSASGISLIVSNGWIEHPNRVGFEHFAGLMNGGPAHFFSWNKILNGEVTGEIGYAPDR